MNHTLVTMRGPGEIDYSNLSDFEAGIATLALINDVYPGIRWKDLPGLAAGVRPGTMDGWLTNLKKAVGTVKDGIGDVLKDTGNYVGGALGDTVRLATDEKVIDGAARLGTAYATNGGSEGVRSLFGDKNDVGGKVLEFISGLGASAKSGTLNTAGAGGVNMSVLPWAIGGFAVLALVFGGRR
jgi:hypothetical protein